MKAQYEKVVRLVCGDNWNSDEISYDEREGAIVTGKQIGRAHV